MSASRNTNKRKRKSALILRVWAEMILNQLIGD
jgi:hypothetical protein